MVSQGKHVLNLIITGIPSILNGLEFKNWKELREF